MAATFRDRTEAGKLLAKKLTAYRKKDNVIVLALPRGGVPVAFWVAKALKAPLDLMMVRKLGLPGHEEVAMGAIALPDICSFNEEVIQNNMLTQEDITTVVEKETKELQRRNQIYRNNAPLPDIKDKTVILIDDGVATGADMRAAIQAVMFQKPQKIVVAIPTAPGETLMALKRMADDVICLSTPPLFFAVGQDYQDFSQTSDEEVIALLNEAGKK
ncbi:MAG: phosphoribosyltransferase [Bdellovibrionales bacterium]